MEEPGGREGVLHPALRSATDAAGADLYDSRGAISFFGEFAGPDLFADADASLRRYTGGMSCIADWRHGVLFLLGTDSRGDGTGWRGTDSRGEVLASRDAGRAGR